MSVYSIWESYFPPDAAEQGRRATERIWVDMRQLAGYLDHQLLEDLDDAGHVFVVSRWISRERADQVLVEYAGHPNAAEANRLAAQPRRRFVAVPAAP